MVGGTSLALQIGHRESIDIDLFGNLEVDEIELSKMIKIPQKTVERWLSVLKTENKIEYRGSNKTGGYFVI